MAASVREHHPDARVVAVVRSGVAPNTNEPYDALDLDNSVSIPELLSSVLADDDGLAIYLSPTVCVYDTLAPVVTAAAQHGVALVRRLSQLPEDGRRPDFSDLLRAGSVSDGLVAVSPGEPALALLDWWSQGRQGSDRRGAPNDAGRWLELASERFPSAVVVADLGCEVGYWNLHERPLERHGDRVIAGGMPLRSLNFAGFRPDRPYWLSEAATRVRVVQDDVLAELCGAYAERLRDADWSAPRRQIAGIQRLGDGQRVDQFLRDLWKDAAAAGNDFGDPLSDLAADAFIAWAREPGERGAASGVNRYLMAVYLARADLQEAFPDLDALDGDRFVQWGWDHGGDDVLAELLPAAPDDVTLAGNSRVAVNVIGYLGETLGLAEAARLYIKALSAVDIPVATTAITADLPIEDDQQAIARYGSSVWNDLISPVAPAFNLACLNGDHLHHLIRTQGESILRGRPTIGQWGWETDVLPPSWTGAFRYVDEVWVYSTFMAENLGRLLPVPVVVVPPAIVMPDPSSLEMEIARDGRFTFLSMLDMFSTLERKNPLGLIDAFRQAFSPNEGPRLLIKTINARFREEAADELRFRARGRSDIEFVDSYLEPGEKAALLARADCYVSLHRSEGFGLPLAESMAVGTPVIATGYSGNTDFTTPFNSYLVDWIQTRVGPGSTVYPADGRWAEPDIEHAAAQMRAVWEHPEQAAERAARARVDIRRLYAPTVVGEMARTRLERLLDVNASYARRRASLAGPALDELERALAFDLRHGAAPEPRGAAGLLRRSVLRLMLPFTHHQHEVDRTVLSALRELRAGLERAEERGLRDDRSLSRLEAAIERGDRRSSSNGGGDRD